MKHTAQRTFGTVEVTEYNSSRQCEKHVEDSDGIRQCENTVNYQIRHRDNVSMFCRTHMRDVWLEIVGDA